jgi:hypothetical protein
MTTKTPRDSTRIAAWRVPFEVLTLIDGFIKERCGFSKPDPSLADRFRPWAGRTPIMKRCRCIDGLDSLERLSF